MKKLLTFFFKRFIIKPSQGEQVTMTHDQRRTAKIIFNSHKNLIRPPPIVYKIHEQEQAIKQRLKKIIRAKTVYNVSQTKCHERYRRVWKRKKVTSSTNYFIFVNGNLENAERQNI